MRIETFGTHNMPLDVVSSAVPPLQDGHSDPWSAWTAQADLLMSPAKLSAGEDAEEVEDDDDDADSVDAEEDDIDGAGI